MAPPKIASARPRGIRGPTSAPARFTAAATYVLIVPTVRRTATNSVAARPGAPRPASIRSASGTEDGSPAPSTPTMATASPR